MAHSSTHCVPSSVQSNVTEVIGLPCASTGKPVPSPHLRIPYFSHGFSVQLSSEYCRKSVAHRTIMPVGIMFTLRPFRHTTVGALQSLMMIVYSQIVSFPQPSVTNHLILWVPYGSCGVTNVF